MKRTTLLVTILSLILLVSLALVSLASCGSEEPKATPTPTKTPRVEALAPTATPGPPTATPEPPTPTPEPPTATPEPQVELPAPLLVAGEIVVARSEANAGAAEVGALQKDDVVEGLERSADGQWTKICCVAGNEAWVESASLLAVPEGMVIEPTVAPTPSAFAESTTDGVNARKGPGTAYGKVGQVYTGDPLEVRGKNAEGTWYQLCCISGSEAWVSADFLKLSGETAAIAVVEAPPLNAETQADAAPAAASTSGSSARGDIGLVYIGEVEPRVDNPPPGKYFGYCLLLGKVNRPVREVPPARPTLIGDINPLTGLPIDPERLQQRIFIARYGHEPAVRSYFGISAPDLVFEELLDSMNTTRLTSVWLGGDAPQIGPLRSFRSTSIQLAQIFDAPMASSGAHGTNTFFAYQAGIEDLDEACYPRLYFNNPAGGGYQNRVLTTSTNLRNFLQNNGLDTGVKIKPFTFSDAAPGGSQAANRVVIPYINRGYYEVEWRYDPSTGRYARYSGSQRTPLVDSNNGQQVTASNVVIMEVQHDLTDLLEDSVGGRSVRTYIAGREGPATIIRDGVAIQGRWRALDKFSGLELVDAAGNAIPLKPGNTWFQVVPPNYGVTIVG